MVLEATMVIVDDSDFMRNGDYIPTRIDAQSDAVTLICQSKRQSHPENTIGLITLSKPELLITLSTDVSKLYAKLHTVQPKGDTKAGAAARNRTIGDLGQINFLTSIRIAHLALRHRLSKNQKMRIVVFVGSCIDEDEKELERLGKRLKKEKVAIDVINFGEVEANTAKLTALVEAANGSSNTTTEGGSHLVSVPPGVSLRESLLSSPIIVGEDGRGAVPLSGFEFGVDPNEDPELLLALRVSMEDQRMRLEQSRQGATPVVPVQEAIPEEGSEDQLLQQALAMSREGIPEMNTAFVASDVDFEAMTEEEQIEYALRMSLNGAGQDEEPARTSGEDAAPVKTEPEKMETDVNIKEEKKE